MLFTSSYKLFSFLGHLNFSPDIFVHFGKRLDKKGTVNLKFMTSQSGKQTITIHKLSNISRTKGNKTLKFCQLIEYNVKNNVL